jgi:hypothetical protein
LKTYYALSEADIAQHYLNGKGSVDLLPRNADALVADVERYLRASKLDHRLDEAVTIAREAFTIAEQVREQQTHEDFQASIREGYGDQREMHQAAPQYADEMARAAEIAAMSMNEFAANRGQMGLHKSTLDFLAGM